MSPLRQIYFDHEQKSEEVAPPFSSGEAGFVWLDAGQVFESDTQVEIEPNSYHALHGHGIVDRLRQLDWLMGSVGSGRDAILAPRQVEYAGSIFYDADRDTYGGTFDFRVAQSQGVEYRVVINNRQYQRTLSRLQFLCGTAARTGRGVRLRM